MWSEPVNQGIAGHRGSRSGILLETGDEERKWKVVGTRQKNPARAPP
jgi:hypothetical protein